MLGEALAGELVCLPKVLVVASLQIAIAAGCHLASPALYIDGFAKIGEVESRAIRSVIASMRSRRGRSGTDENSARIAIGPVEGVGPAAWKSGRRSIVDRIVQVLRSIATRLDNDNAASGRVKDCIEIVRPSFDGDKAVLVRTIFKIVERASSMQLQENDVTGL